MLRKNWWKGHEQTACEQMRKHYLFYINIGVIFVSFNVKQNTSNIVFVLHTHTLSVTHKHTLTLSLLMRIDVNFYEYESD